MAEERFMRAVIPSASLWNSLAGICHFATFASKTLKDKHLRVADKGWQIFICHPFLYFLHHGEFRRPSLHSRLFLKAAAARILAQSWCQECGLHFLQNRCAWLEDWHSKSLKCHISTMTHLQTIQSLRVQMSFSALNFLFKAVEQIVQTLCTMLNFLLLIYFDAFQGWKMVTNNDGNLPPLNDWQSAEIW